MKRALDKQLDPMARLILRFVGIFLAVLAVLTMAWPLIVPAYTWLAAWVARVGFHAIESPNVSVLQAKGAELWVYRIVGPGQIAPFTWFDRYTFFAIIPLVSLFAATPGLGWMKRLVRTLISVGVLFLVQAAYIVISVQLSYAAVGLLSVSSLFARTLNGWQVLVRVLWEAAPLVLWGALTARIWGSELRTVRDEWKRRRKLRTKGNATLGYDARKGWGS